jgi:hypothetical protein
MINLSPSTPPATGPSGDFDRLITLLSFVTDPKACAQRISEIHQKQLDSADVIAAAEKTRGEIAKEREAMAAEREQHTKQLAAERADHEAKCNLRDHTINDRDRESKTLHTEAQVARDEALKITADLNARLDRIKAAAA